MESNNKIPISRTVELGDFQAHLRDLRPWGGQEELKRVFDEIPLREIRGICLNNITGNEWLTKRIKAYLEINDYLTVFMLLRHLNIESRDSQNNTLRLMVEVVEKCLREDDSYDIKDALEILCDKIYNCPEIYNKRVRKLFREILKKYDRKDRYGTYGKEALILIKIFLVLSRLGDKSFLPLLRNYLPDAKNLAHLMNYSNTCKDEVLADGLRMLLIHYLENK